MKSDVLLIGAGGMFGSVAKPTLSSRYRVAATSRDGAGGTIAYDLLSSDQALAQLLGDTLQEGGVVINAAAVLAGSMARPDEIERGIAVNALYPHRLSRAASAVGARVIQISTDGVFAREAGEVDEAAELGPDTAYGCAKALGELHGEGALTIRCSIVGPPPANAARGLWGFVTSRPTAATIDGYDDHWWSGVLTRQLAEVCAALVPVAVFAAARQLSAVHHLAPNGALTKYDLVCALRDALRPDIAVRRVTTGKPTKRILISRYNYLNALTAPLSDWREAVKACAAQVRTPNTGSKQ